MIFRKAEISDIKQVSELALLLWPDATMSELIDEFTEIIDDVKINAVFVCEYQNQIVAFAHVCLRYDYVEGTDSSPVGYMEGIFVSELYRRMGIARKLFKTRIDWAKTKGCEEVASDTELNNIDSQHFHDKMGFCEVNRIVCYTKKID